MNFYIYFYIYLEIDVFYFNQLLHNISNLILIRFKGIELIISMFIFFKWFEKLVIRIYFTMHTDMKPCATKRQQTNKNDLETWCNELPNIHILRRNPTSSHQLDGCTQNLHTNL
jgi:hypothetical protein